MTKKIYLRFAQEEDCDDLFNWRNDPVTVKFSPTGEVEYDSHVVWFRKKLGNINTHIFIIINESYEKIGMIRFDKEADKATISINLNPQFRGKGYGKLSLRKSLEFYFDNFPVEIIIANIVNENIVSKKLFFSIGFKENGIDKENNQICTELRKKDFYQH